MNMYKTADLSKPTSLLKLFLCVVFAVLCVVFPGAASAGVKNGLLLSYKAIIPSLFPFMFACTYLFSLISTLENRAVKYIACLLFGLVGGFPMGARALYGLVEDGTLTKKKASLLLVGAVNAGPAFLISSVGAAMFRNYFLGVVLLVSLSVSSIICVVFFLLTEEKIDFTEKSEKAVKFTQSAGGFTAALETAVRSTIYMCGYVSFFSCVLALFQKIVPVGGIAAYLGAAVCEVSNGCSAAAEVGGTLGAYLACAAVSICGISVLMQVRSVLLVSGITMKYLLISRPIHCALSFIFVRLLLSIEVLAEAFAAANFAGEIFSINPVFSFFFLLTGFVFVTCSKRFAPMPKKQ